MARARTGYSARSRVVAANMSGRLVSSDSGVLIANEKDRAGDETLLLVFGSWMEKESGE